MMAGMVEQTVATIAYLEAVSFAYNESANLNVGICNGFELNVIKLRFYTCR